MESITPGAKALTPNDNPPAAASSAQTVLAPDSTPGAKPTSTTKRSTRTGARTWTPEQAREILVQSALESQKAGLTVRAYNTTRGSVVFEVMEHRLTEGALVPV